METSEEKLRDRMTAKEVLHEIQRTLDRIAIQLARNEKLLKQMMTKDEFNEKFDQMFIKSDQLLSILKRLDERRIADMEYLKQRDRTLGEREV